MVSKAWHSNFFDCVVLRWSCCCYFWSWIDVMTMTPPVKRHSVLAVYSWNEVRIEGEVAQMASCKDGNSWRKKNHHSGHCLLQVQVGGINVEQLFVDSRDYDLLYQLCIWYVFCSCCSKYLSLCTTFWSWGLQTRPTSMRLSSRLAELWNTAAIKRLA